VRHIVATWAVALVATLSAELSAAPTVAALSEDERAALDAIVADPPPEKVIQDTHYFISNEQHPHRFRKALSGDGSGLGGIYLGVGAEQGYLFSSWALPEVMLLVDFDQVVVDVHAIYRIFLLHSGTADEFIARWHKDNLDASRSLIESEIAGDEEEKRVVRAFERARPAIHPRLSGLQTRYGNLDVPTFLTEPDLYDWLVAMEKNDRVRFLRGDFTADGALRGIAKAAKKIKMPVRGLYLSNVEFYFDYDSGLGKNLERLPADDRSLTIRTYPFKAKKDDDYRYFVQKTVDFHAWLEEDGIPNFRAIFTRDAGKLEDDVWYLPGP
jgi:hypothetical protein